MTKVPRRRPAPAAPAKEWPSYTEPEPRVTTEGKVSSLPSPVQAMWAEALGRCYQGVLLPQAEGLCVALAILTCRPLEDVRAEIIRRAHVPVSASRRRS